MSAQNYGELLAHAKHNIVVATYGDDEDPENVAIECVDCYFTEEADPFDIAYVEEKN